MIINMVNICEFLTTNSSIDTVGHKISWAILAGLIIWISINIIKKYNLSWLWLILVLPVAWLSGWFAGLPIVFACHLPNKY